MHLRRRVRNALVVVGMMALLPWSAALAESIDILRTIPLEVKGYPAAQCLEPKVTSADQVIQVLNSTPVLLVHMEALRRGYYDLPPAEQNKLLSLLRKRHTSKEHDLLLGFDLGYAELVYNQNKTGLFFLRKANDKFQDQFSNLAYGMAQVEADINLENAKPEEMTTRKMDAMYRLGDAVKIDASKHQPGFWPSYIKVIEKLKPLAAYKGFSNRDFSLTYLPYGNTVVPLNNINTSTLSMTKPDSGGLFSNALSNPCVPGPESSLENKTHNDNTTALSNLLAQRSAYFGGSTATIQFYPTPEPHLYQVRVVGSGNWPPLSFQTHAMPNILEDVDGDGVFEIVARQYRYNPLQPLLVYRYTSCGFEPDNKILENFH